MKKIKFKIKEAFRKLIRWALKTELQNIESQIRENEIQYKRIENLLGNLDISVDVHYRAKSWAVISIQGERTDFIKFIDLGRKEIDEIYRFLRHFDRTKVDAEPRTFEYLKIPRLRNKRY